jgi:hypothetical protein
VIGVLPEIRRTYDFCCLSPILVCAKTEAKTH